MKIVETLKNFFKKIFSKVPNLRAGKEEIIGLQDDLGSISNADKNRLAEQVKVQEPKSYTEILKSTLERAKERGEVERGLDFEKDILGAVLEEKGASKELVELYRKSKVKSMAPKYWESQSSQNIDSFFIPELSDIESTVDGIKDMIEEYRKQVMISSDGNGYIVRGKYDDYDRGQTGISVSQKITVGNDRKVEYRVDESKYREDINKVMEHKRILNKENGQGVKLIESIEGNQLEQQNLYYEVDRKGKKAVITIGRNDDKRSPYTVSYEQTAPQNLLDTEKGLGFYQDNLNAKRFYEGDLKENPTALKDELMFQGINLDEQNQLED